MSTTTPRSVWERDTTYMVIYVVLALIYFLPALLAGQHVYGTDYLAAAYFKNEMTSAQMARGVLPGWLPHVYGGVPLFANPASTFQPIKVLADLVLPVSKLFAASLIFHFSFAGIGTYLLARELDVRRWIAFVAGLAFQFTGLTMSFVYAGHDGRIIVATLAPLFFFFLHRGARKGTLPSFAGAAATLGFALLSFQIQSAYYLLLAGGLWALFALWRTGHLKAPKPLARRVALGLGAVAFAFALASVNFLPFLGYIDASPRAIGEDGRGYEYSTSWSMPPREITGLAVPEDVGVSVGDPMTGEPGFPSYRGANPFKLHTEYAGAFVLLLVGLGFYYMRRDRYWLFFAGLSLFALSISFGGHTPLYRLYYAVLPGTTMFRAPSIAFFLVSFSLVMMAALTLERLASLHARAGGETDAAGGGGAGGAQRAEPPDENGGRSPATIVGWLAIAIAGAGVLLAGAVNAGAEDPGRAVGVFRFALFAAAIAGVLWAWLSDRVGRRAAVVVLAVLTVADLWIIDRRFFHTVPSPDQMFARDDVVEFLLSQPGRDRVWVLPFGQVYRGGANYLMKHDIDQAGGEHGNQLQRYNEFVGAGDETYVDWHNFLEDTRFINAANVRYIIAGVELEVPWPEVHRGRAIVYENPNALPRAYLVNDVRLAPEPDGALAAMRAPGFDPTQTAILYREPEGGGPEPADVPGTAQLVDYSPNRVVVRTDAAARSLLVLADNMYQGWEAQVDGEPTEIVLANHTFRGVVVDAGQHEVTFRFRPTSLRVGFWIYAAGFALLMGYGLVLVLRRWRRPAAPDG
ncbi:MAG: YfhO family protein [Longimicrobiales bacterium]|nr:YfhO family protein [Longimicrobiales bacterium]